MGEKRKPELVLLLRKQGKEKHKIEIYSAKLWGNTDPNKKYRIRVDGKWLRRSFKSGKKEKQSFFGKYQFRDILFRSILK